MVDSWWKSFFDDNFGALLDRSNDKTLEPTVDFLMDQLNLAPGGRIYDQCCGTGALTLAFARRGVAGVGVDQAEGYIASAKSKATEAGLTAKTEFHADDAFNFVARPPCDAAVNWYSSFGYDRDDRVNVKMFERLHDSLKPGGQAAVEYMNVLELMAHFRPVFTRMLDIRGEKVEVEKATDINLKTRMVASEWTYKFPDGHQSQRSGESRLYLSEDIGQLMTDAGFKDIKFHGDIDGRPLEKLSPRIICTGRKPGR